MELERRPKTPRRSGMSTPARLVIGALAVFGAVTLVGWVLASLLSFIKIGLLIVVIVGLAAWIVSAKGSR